MAEPAEADHEESASFSSLVLMLGTAALVHLGASPEPGQGEPRRNLGEARRLIDWLGILADKTEGRLTREERMLLEQLLYDLRMRYLTAEGKA
jgi:hypothetical protein